MRFIKPSGGSATLFIRDGLHQNRAHAAILAHMVGQEWTGLWNHCAVAYIIRDGFTCSATGSSDHGDM